MPSQPERLLVVIPKIAADSMRLCNGVSRHISTSSSFRINQIKMKNQKVNDVAVVYTRHLGYKKIFWCVNVVCNP